VLEHGLIDSIALLVSLDFCGAKQIIQSLSKLQDRGIIILAVYVDDILITGSDAVGIERLGHTYRSTSSLKIWGGPSISWELKSLIASMGSLYLRENMLVISL
ncbi:UNVERIFIED_CONTAM: hypothetical protein Slati_4580000, partial [Sesamum latifolium]